ncbi:8348_t:CDS:2 [Ambispora leptoticha]|uniref:8348_t:CDS:1 n=1 Tax=Ambispora leptoticha TaxID=144679 RepID=A0A9N9B1P4_9GLOM|nr:8348_t:CDS:2 [Ambispora leptoticha]
MTTELTYASTSTSTSEIRNEDKKIIQHVELPEVINELSITLRLNIQNHNPDWACVFHKGEDVHEARTPALWLTPKNSAPHPRFSVTNNWNEGINSVGSGLSLNRWYHLAYTLSDSEKRLDFYIDGKWIGFHSVQQVQTQQIIFNHEPLYIGADKIRSGFTGQIGYNKL